MLCLILFYAAGTDGVMGKPPIHFSASHCIASKILLSVYRCSSAHPFRLCLRRGGIAETASRTHGLVPCSEGGAIVAALKVLQSVETPATTTLAIEASKTQTAGCAVVTISSPASFPNSSAQSRPHEFGLPGWIHPSAFCRRASATAKVR
jgi:hypothetical protein